MKNWVFQSIVGLACVILGSAAGQSQTTGVTEIRINAQLRARLEKPVVVSLSKPGERRWGRHQFVSISDYPGGKILLRCHDAEDAVSAYGTPSPTYISSDNGETWQPFSEEGLPPAGLSCPVFNNEFICMPMAKPLDVKRVGLTMPGTVSTSFSYNSWMFFLVEQCPDPVKRYMSNYEISRWTAGDGWKPDTMNYDTSGALVCGPGKDPQATLLSRTSFERPPLQLGDELLFADYRSNFVQEDGFIPKTWGITCMVSRDNGRSWKRRATIATDRIGSSSLTEPALAQSIGNELVCVIRRADHGQKSMLITYSKDRGNTWEAPRSLDEFGDFGVLPALVKLDCGVMVLSYGRPGIFLTFSPTGSGRDWTKPFCMLEGDRKALLKHTDGYTSLLPIGPNRLLLAYSDFDHVDAEGKQHKAIMVRAVTIESMAN